MLTSARVSDPEPSTDADRPRRPAPPPARARRLTGAEEWFWYVFAAMTYIVVGIWHKFILNWIMGPAWLVAVVMLGPQTLDWLARLVGRRRT
jgi:hypothetical protein